MFKFAATIAVASAYAWTEDQAYISLHLSNYAYCNVANYETTNFSYTQDTAGFMVTDVIYDSSNDTEGYVGYLPSDESIYVVFRGSVSADNWATDLDTVKTDYVIWPECNC